MTTPWTTSALCAQVDPEMWFPEKGGVGYAPARRICMRCPVRPECLDDAMTSETPGERNGMRAGLTPRQRDRAAAADHANDDERSAA